MGASPPHGNPVRHIIVADEDPAVVAFVLHLLRQDSHAVFHAYDALAATQLATAIDHCDLLISNTKVVGADGVELIRRLRGKRPELPILYIANIGRSTPEIEAQLPPGILILREPFTAEQLRAAIGPLLDGGRPSSWLRTEPQTALRSDGGVRTHKSLLFFVSFVSFVPSCE